MQDVVTDLKAIPRERRLFRQVAHDDLVGDLAKFPLKPDGRLKTMYLIRHGYSAWNKAQASMFSSRTMIGAYISRISAEKDTSPLTDAELDQVGISQALLLCSALNGAIVKTAVPRCVGVGNKFNPNAIPLEHDARSWSCFCRHLASLLDPKMDQHSDGNFNELHRPVFEEYHSHEAATYSHAELITGTFQRSVAPDARALPSVQYVVSPLVRAIDTLYFAMLSRYSGFRTNELRLQVSPYIQEIGKGFDGQVHSNRATIENIHRMHDAQAEQLTQTMTTFKAVIGQEQTNILSAGMRDFYTNMAVPFRSQEEFAEFFQSDRHTKDVYKKMMRFFLRDVVTKMTSDYIVAAGHSHFFGKLLASFSDDDNCIVQGKAMLDNGAVWQVGVYDNEDGPDAVKRPFVIRNCELIYGHLKKKETPRSEEPLRFPCCTNPDMV
eukprot:c3061_g1_i1.p1 GENE.c3061_g1_i1~~c3061_g1_i1.p1  ORF type:complete len:500 (-),score=99.05 c3061_g1_i1:40-1350(-)